MESSKRERFSKVVKGKGGTVSTRRHRFESFNQRIAKLNIDPVRHVRRQIVEKDNVSSTTSYFRTDLDHWRDLNLSENFAAFLLEIQPFCDSLPQILHSHQKIVDTLFLYIEKRDVLSLEPLLSLIGHLAHDMGVRFETHFERAAKLVASLAANHPEIEVIEWSFTCLAWLLKFLSRLIVLDLRPTYDIVAPLLGKEAQKTYVTRFAGEAMSFLIRKAALMYHKNKSPLELIVEHIWQDLDMQYGTQKNVDLYQYGIMTLFADAVKGINNGIHSCGTLIYQYLLEHMIHTDKCVRPAIAVVVRGITVNIIHHTNAETFSPLLDVLVRMIEESTHSLDSRAVSVYGDLLFIMTAVRKGSRILGWTAAINCSVKLLEYIRSSQQPQAREHILGPVEKTLAVILQSSPLDLVLPKVQVAVDLLVNENKKESFLTFCTYFSELGEERFQSLLAPSLFK